MTKHTNAELDLANAEKELLAMHHFLSVMPGDPGPSLPMVVRMGAVIARLEERGRGKGVVDVETATTKNVVVRDAPTQTTSSTEVLTNSFGLILVELDILCVGTVYVATKARFAFPDDAVAFLRLYQHENIPQNEDVTPQSMHVVTVDEERFLPSHDVAAAFRIAQIDCVIGAW